MTGFAGSNKPLNKNRIRPYRSFTRMFPLCNRRLAGIYRVQNYNNQLFTLAPSVKRTQTDATVQIRNRGYRVITLNGLELKASFSSFFVR